MNVFNSLTRRVEELKPLADNTVRLYTCGPTVYNYFHIGNARPFVVFDTLRKYLEYRGKKVTFVQNFTDVDDKIINKAREEGITAGEVSEKYIGEYFKDAAALNVYIKTRSLRNREEAERLNTACRQMQQRYGALAEKIYNDVEAALLR